ncbi:MAG TPA: long-chain-fatty-acid--CoA ligase [Bacillales bacterium]|nr:long-chain-fatty-acid--CoA ligase [Bacillales bacterium]
MGWNLNDNLINTARKYPNRNAYLFMNESVTYNEFNHKVNSFASALSSRGVGKGDTVALLLGNSPEFLIAYYGILRSGAAAVPMNPLYTAEEVTYILSDCKAKVVVAVPSQRTTLSGLLEKLEHLEFIIYTETNDSSLSFDQLLEQAQRDFESPSLSEDDLAIILYTSGTTGKPKGAMLSHRNMASNAESTVSFLKINSEDLVIAVLPMFHVFCMTVCINAPILNGATIVILPKFSPSEVIQTIRDCQATVFVGVPTMYNFMLHLPDVSSADLASLRVCISGGAALPVELLHKFQNYFRTFILEGYGLTESSPVTAFNPLEGVRKPGSIGKDIPRVKNKVVDPNGIEVPRGEVGELIVQGPNVMLGYLGNPEATALALRGGWLYTGDMATMDEDGYIFIVDRKKDMISVGGFNVYPREVEEVLYQHPFVLEAAVIGVPDEEYGERVKAYIVKKVEDVSVPEILAFCQERLVKYKIPKEVEFLEELPKNRTGKILRRALRATN